MQRHCQNQDLPDFGIFRMFTNPGNPPILAILILTFPAGTDFARARMAGRLIRRAEGWSPGQDGHGAVGVQLAVQRPRAGLAVRVDRSHRVQVDAGVQPVKVRVVVMSSGDVIGDDGESLVAAGGARRSWRWRCPRFPSGPSKTPGRCPIPPTSWAAPGPPGFRPPPPG